MNGFLVAVLLCFGTLNAAFCALVIGLLRRDKNWPRWIGFALAGWCALMIALALFEVAAPVEWRPALRRWLYFPIAVQMAWNLLVLEGTILVAAAVAIAWPIVRALRRNKTAPATVAPSLEPSPADLSRRRFLYLLAAGAAPATATVMGLHGTLSRYDLRVREYRVLVAGLPPELEGFTIAHVSDLHSGIFCGPERLAKIVSATNDLNADLIAITGDVINNSMEEFPDALAAIRRLRSRYGVYFCEGNHDLIPSDDQFANACADAGLNLLREQSVIIPVENRRLILGGVPWLGRRFTVQPELVESLYPLRQEGDVRLLLAHHPHFFDSAESADLVLAGHTHGGQVMAGPVGLGPLFFKYWSGRYQRGDTTMIVSNGAGDWFPCRIGAPAEVALIRLTRAA
jgi:predicted MPP superfamily phosphohydrolase